jgi:hypothetical protein
MFRITESLFARPGQAFIDHLVPPTHFSVGEIKAREEKASAQGHTVSWLESLLTVQTLKLGWRQVPFIEDGYST